MIVYFLRHAEAEDGVVDFDRQLTVKGLEQAEKVGKFCAKNGLDPDLILTSPVIRARQTAEIVAKRLGKDRFLEVPWAACGMDPDCCVEDLGSYEEYESVMLVGHEPDFSAAIAFLCGMKKSEGIRVRKASLTAVEISSLREAGGSIQFALPVRLM